MEKLGTARAYWWPTQSSLGEKVAGPTAFNGSIRSTDYGIMVLGLISGAWGIRYGLKAIYSLRVLFES